MIKIFGSVLLFFYNICNSYGGAILLFGLLVKLIMLPFQMKSKHSMMRTTMLTPRVKELEKRYATNKQKYQEEVAKLYKEAKINPMSGCLWTLIPFPIIIILYSVVRQPLVALMKLTQENIDVLTDVVTKLGYYTAPAKADAYSQMTIANVLHERFADIVSNPSVAEFAGQLKDINFHFLGLNLIEKPSLMFWNTPEWANGLWYIALLMFLIPFLSAGLTILQTKLSQKMNPPQDAQTAQTSKTMNLVMPLMSIYICFIMPSAMYIGAVAVPYFAVASVPALQCVRMPSPWCSRAKPSSPIERLMATSSSRMRCASAKRASRMAGTVSSAWVCAVCHILSSAQKRFTAVGREEARYSFVSRSRAKKASLSSVSICEAASASA